MERRRQPMKMKVKMLLGVLLSLALVLGLIPGMRLTVLAGEPVSYRDSDGATQTCSNYTVVTNSTTTLQNGKWYVVNRNVDVDSRITVNGTVNLILCDGKTLNAQKGITVEGSNSLTVYAQSRGGGMGTLNAIGVANEDDFIYPAGIGSYESDGGTVTINGGNITATGANGAYGGGAGIGGCYSPAFMNFYGSRGCIVTINGGNVNASGGTVSAGIGGSFMNYANTVTINGGSVTATGGMAAAGIGTGANYIGDSYSTVTINGGTVTAVGGTDNGYYMGGAGIGAGFGGHGLVTIITGGTVQATGGTAAAGIGDGSGYDGNRLGSYTINGGTVTATGGNGGTSEDGDTYGCGAGIGGGYSLTYNADGYHGKNKTYGTFNFEGVTIYVGSDANSMSEISFQGNFGFNFTNMHYHQYVRTEGQFVASAYSVTVDAGENMTKTADSGDASQTDISDAMTDVVYTADEGYYFPTDYSVDTVNGISVTRDSYTQITVSGTPTDDTVITLTSPTAKTKADAPTSVTAVNCTTLDNNDGKLTGVTAVMEYKKSDAESWTDGTGSDITGLVPGTYYVRVKATDTTFVSDNQELTVNGFSFFASHSLSLDGDIGVNFYLNLTDEQAACATITFKWMKNGSEKTEVVNLSEENRTRYGYKTICRVSASEVRAEINAHLVINAGQDEQIEETDTYSVATYANVILNDAEYASSYSNPNPNQTLEKLRILVSALLDYGDHANAYFDANAAALATPAVVIPAEYAESAYYSVTDLPEGVTFEGATLSLRSQTTLSLYFKKTASVSDEVVLTMDGKIENKDYERKQSGNEYVIRIRNIAAPELNTVFTVKVNGTGIVNYSPLTYCYKAQSSSDTKLANTVKALYKFWQEANRFFSKETD